MIKRLIVSLLSISLLAASLFGCSSGNNKSNSTTSGNTTDTTQKSKPVKVVYLQSPSASFKPSPPEVLEEIHKYILEKTNIDLQVITGPTDAKDFSTKLNMMLASKEKIDFFFNVSWAEYQRKGLLADITDEVQKYAQDVAKAWGGMDHFNKAKTSDGKIWGIPNQTDMVNYPIYIREDWLKAVNLSVPKTIDEYENVLKAFKDKDLAGDGKTIPMLTKVTDSAKDLQFSLAGAFLDKGFGLFIDKDGKAKPPYLDPGYKDFIVKMNGWFTKGYIDRECFGYKTNQFNEVVKANRVGSTAIWNSVITLNEAELQKVAPQANYVIANLTGPKGKAETVNTVNRFSGGSTSCLIIPQYSTVKEEVIKLYNWGFQDKANHIISRYGMENKNWKWTDKEKGIYELIGSPAMGGEYNIFFSNYYSTSVREKESPTEKHTQYLFSKEIWNYGRAKMPIDRDIPFDHKNISDAVPTLEDINRIVGENTVKFIMGIRPLSEYDKYLEELKKAGIDKYIDELTRQYNLANKK